MCDSGQGTDSVPQFPYLQSGGSISCLRTQTHELLFLCGCRHHCHGMEPGREAAAGWHAGRHGGCVGHGGTAGDPHPSWTHRWGSENGVDDQAPPRVLQWSVSFQGPFTTNSLLCIKTVVFVPASASYSCVTKHPKQECKSEQPLWRIVKRFLKKLKIVAVWSRNPIPGHISVL